MGSMEARGRLPLPFWSKWCVGRGNGCTLAHNCNLHDWGWAPGAGEAEDGGGAAPTGELPWAGKASALIPFCQILYANNSLFLLFLQALSDLLTPQLSSIISGCPSVSVLRDLYSMLGEGGLRFPAIVVDTDPDCWHYMSQWFMQLVVCARPHTHNVRDIHHAKNTVIIYIWLRSLWQSVAIPDLTMLFQRMLVLIV